MNVLKRRKRNPDRRQRGQAMVEFALMLPIFLVLMFIFIDFGVGLSRWIVITNATREAARFGAVGASVGDIEQRAVDTSAGVLTLGDVTVTYPDGGDRGDPVAVRSTYDYELITPLGVFLSIAFDSLAFSTCTDMRLELAVSGAVGGSGC